MSKIKLKPCPFCGGDDCLISVAKNYHWKTESNPRYEASITCLYCDVKITELGFATSSEALDAAVATWNRRIN